MENHIEGIAGKHAVYAGWVLRCCCLRRTRFLRFLPGLVAGLVLIDSSDVAAAARTKAGSGTTLNVNSAWVGGVQPGWADTALWTNTSTTGSHTLGGDLTWGEIEIANPSGDITFAGTGGFTLTLNGVSGVGIDMASATRNLTRNATLAIGASQEWNVGAGRTLSVTVVNGGGNIITKSGAGTLTLGSSAAFNNVGLVLNTGTFELNGNNISLARLAGSGGTIQNAGANATFTVAAGWTTPTLRSTICFARDGRSKRRADEGGQRCV